MTDLDTVTTAIDRLKRDIAKASYTLSKDEARFLVDAYYMMQDNRIRSAAQVRSLSASEEPHAVLAWLEDQSDTLEKQIKRALDYYSVASIQGQWLKAQIGIGPVIAAGMLAHLDVTRAKTSGGFWRFAGLDSTVKWEKGKKRPWNASLKRLCWLLGESFVKTSGNENSIYGKMYVERKAREIEFNEAGRYAEQAAQVLASRKIGKDTIAYAHYAQGKLPPAHIHARAKRWAVKMFLSHFHAICYFMAYGRLAPQPYVIAILAHDPGHYVPPPMVELIPGMEQHINEH